MSIRRKIFQNFSNVFCLLLLLQLKGYYSEVNIPLLYSTKSDIRITNTSQTDNIKTVVKYLYECSAVDFLHNKDRICWSENEARLIQCINYNETHVGDKVKIATGGIVSPAGIAIDWYTNKLYWTDAGTDKIEVVCVEHKHRKVIISSEIDFPSEIAVAPKDRLMFWIEQGKIPKIERAGMNGDPATRKTIVEDTISWATGITIDYDNNLIYWMDIKLEFVDVMDFNGENRKSVVKEGLRGKGGSKALTFLNNKLYWTEFTRSIYTWDISTNGPTKELINPELFDQYLSDLKVYDRRRQVIPTGDYPCKVSNGGCSHLCLLSPNPPGYECACPTGYKLKENSNITCYKTPQSFTKNTSSDNLYDEVRELTEVVRILTREISSLKGSLENATTSLTGYQARLDELATYMASNNSRIKCLENRVKDVNLIENQVSALQQEQNAQFQQHLSNELELAGIPEWNNEDVHHIALLAAQKVGVELADGDIDWVARVGSRVKHAGTSDHGASLPRPIVVRLLRKSKRDQIIKASKSRRNITSTDLEVPGKASKVLYKERLTKENRSLFRATCTKSKEHEYSHCWVTQGKIFVKQREGEPAIHIRTFDDLSRVFNIPNDN